VLDNALCVAGLLDEPRLMIPRINSIIDLLLKSAQQTPAQPQDSKPTSQ
jgi:hypothetical protein